MKRYTYWHVHFHYSVVGNKETYEYRNMSKVGFGWSRKNVNGAFLTSVGEAETRMVCRAPVILAAVHLVHGPKCVSYGNNGM